MPPRPFAQRVARLLRAAPAPIVRFWTWPWGGADAIRAALVQELGARRLDASGDGLAAAIRSAATSDPAAVFLLPGGEGETDEPTVADLEAALPLLERGQTLALVEPHARPLGVVPAVTIGPHRLRLEVDEIAQWLLPSGDERSAGDGQDTQDASDQQGAADRAHALAAVTGGWYGPARWLARQLLGADIAETDTRRAAERLVRSDAFRAALSENVLAPLGDEVADVLGRLAGVADVAAAADVELWRVAWLERPRRLAALERALRRHALVPLPPPLQMLGAGERRQTTLQSLAEAALALGRFEQAGHLLRCVGALSAADRVEQLAGSRTPDPAGPDPALLDPALLDPASRDSALLDRASAAHVVAGPRASIAAGDTSAAPTPARDVAPRPGTDISRGPRPTDRPLIELCLLGPPTARRIDVDGSARELHWRLRKAFQSVAYLALAPSQRAAKDDLVAAVWPDADPAAVRRNFHPTLSDARRTLVGSGSGGIVYRQGLYRLDPSLAWRIDVLDMLAAAERGRRLDDEARAASPSASQGAAERASEAALDALRQAWGLYRGPLLDPVVADWVGAQREAAHRVHLEVLRRTGAVARRLGYDTLALDAYRSLLIEEPYEEQIHLDVMELYARLGRRDLVRRQYLRLQDLLEELHVEPTDAARERYHELMG